MVSFQGMYLRLTGKQQLEESKERDRAIFSADPVPNENR